MERHQSSLTYVQLDPHSDLIQQLRDDYLDTLVAPMDGMWENAVIAHATFWKIEDHGQYIGYFCTDERNVLLRFHLVESYLARAVEIFRLVIAIYDIRSAITSTIESLYFAVCLDVQRSIELHSYLFRDSRQPVDLSSGFSDGLFRKARMDELGDIARFYRANTEGAGEWIEPFLIKRLERQELFVLFDRQTLLASGECIPSQKQLPHADLGMVVDSSYRGKGLGSFMLVQLKKYCYASGWTPICSCSADNHASKKAIEKAGFVSVHRIVKVMF